MGWFKELRNNNRWRHAHGKEKQAMLAKRREQKELNKQMFADAVQGIYDGDRDLAQVAEALGLDVVRMVASANSEEILDRIRQLRQLAAERAHLMAAASLGQLAQQRENLETARKACNDIIAAMTPKHGDGPGEIDGLYMPTGGDTPFDVQEVLRKFGEVTVGEADPPPLPQVGERPGEGVDSSDASSRDESVGATRVDVSPSPLPSPLEGEGVGEEVGDG